VLRSQPQISAHASYISQGQKGPCTRPGLQADSLGVPKQVAWAGGQTCWSGHPWARRLALVNDHRVELWPAFKVLAAQGPAVAEKPVLIGLSAGEPVKRGPVVHERSDIWHVERVPLTKGGEDEPGDAWVCRVAE